MVTSTDAGVDAVILSDQMVRNPPELLQALISHRITHLTAVPTLLRGLLPYLQSAAHQTLHEASATKAVEGVPQGSVPPAYQASANLTNVYSHNDEVNHAGNSADRSSEVTVGRRLHLKILISSGEPLPIALAQGLQSCLPDTCRLLNLYGSTEVAADCTWLEVTDSPHSTNGHLREASDINMVVSQQTDSMGAAGVGAHEGQAHAAPPRQEPSGPSPASTAGSGSGLPALPGASGQDTAVYAIYSSLLVCLTPVHCICKVLDYNLRPCRHLADVHAASCAHRALGA